MKGKDWEIILLPCTKVDDRIIFFNDGVKDSDEVEQGLLHGDSVWLEPFPNEDYHRPTHLVNPSLIQTSRLLNLRQVFLLGSGVQDN